MRIVKILNYIFLAFFVFSFSLKFGLPYTYNIEPSVPRNIIEFILYGWPTEWGGIFLYLCLIISILTSFITNFKKNTPLKLSSMDLIVLTWILWNIITSFINGLGTTGTTTAILFINYGLFYFLIRSWNFQNKDTSNFILSKWCLMSFVAITFYGYYQLFEGFEAAVQHAISQEGTHLDNPLFKNRLYGNKVFSTFIYSNSLAGFLILITPIYLGFFISKKSRTFSIQSTLLGFICFAFILLGLLGSFSQLWKYLLVLISFPLSSIALIYFTQSKGAIICLFLALIVGGIYYLIKKSKPRTALLSLIIVSAGYFAIPLLPNAERLSKSFNVRMEYNQSSWEIIKESPLTGSGHGQYGVKYTKYKMPGAEEVQLAHNNYLQLWTEIGLPGMILLLLLFMATYRQIHKDKKLDFPVKLGFMIGVTSLFIHNSIDFDFYVPSLGYLHFFIFALFSNNSSCELPFNKTIKTIILIITIITLSCLTYIGLCLARFNSYFEMGQTFLQNKQYRLAESSYKQAIKNYSYHSGAYIFLSDALVWQKRFEEAELALLHACNANKNNAMTWLKLIHFYQYKEKITGTKNKNLFSAINKFKKLYPNFNIPSK